MTDGPIDLGRVEAFVEVARTGSISRAAEALFVTQPALTARLQALERWIGADLLVRSRHGSRLTEAAARCCPTPSGRWPRCARAGWRWTRCRVAAAGA